MNPDCFIQCKALDCYKGESNNPFYTMSVPKNITNDFAKNLCIYYGSKYKFYHNF